MRLMRFFLGLSLVVGLANVASASAGSCAGLFEGRANVASTNPLMMLPSAPDAPFRYSTFTVEAMDRAFSEGMVLARTRLAALKANPRKPNFENTIDALMRLDEELEATNAILSNFSSVVSNEKLEALDEKWSPEISKLGNDIFFDVSIFDRVKSVYERRNELRLSREQMRILESYYQGFEKSGVNLPEAQKKRIEEIDVQLVLLAQKFKMYSRDAVETAFVAVTDETRLTGIPQDILKAAKNAAIKANQPNAWLISLKGPTRAKVMTFAENRGLREEIWKAAKDLGSLAPFDNRPIILETVRLRRERAQILGYKHHAEMVTEDRMAKTPQAVLNFIAKLYEKYRPAAEVDKRELFDFAKQHDYVPDIDAADRLRPWDGAYYSQKLKTERYAFDSEQLRPYLPLESVHRGALNVAERLHKIRFIEMKSAEVWDPTVKAYEVRDVKGDKLLGFFYFDPYTREGKRPGAWMTNLRQAGESNGEVRRPHVVNVLNLNPPTDGKPTLLTIGEVRTIFHELGHGLHGLLTKTRYRNKSGTNVQWDFVELPSQLNEEWAMDPETLRSFARHYETGEPMPMDFIEKLRRAEMFQVASGGLAYLQQSALDMAWHMDDLTTLKTVEDVARFEERVGVPYQLSPWTGQLMSTMFTHLFSGGYSAGYYSYYWADALVADAFEYFKENGIYNSKIAARFRREILSKGGTEDAGVLYRRFRGQDPDPDALLRRDGFAPNKESEKK